MNENFLYELFDSNHSYDYDKLESPIEETFLNHVIKFLHKETKVIVQYPIPTISGNFRADIALEKDGKIVVIECDGEEYHTKEKDDWYDEWRDALILISGSIQVIYRVKGKDIRNNIYKVFAIIYAHDKNLFDENYADLIEKVEIERNGYIKSVYHDYYYDDNEIRTPLVIDIKRKELEIDFDIFWYKYVLYSILYSDKNIYQLIDEMSSKYIESKDLIRMINEKYPDLQLEAEKQLIALSKRK